MAILRSTTIIGSLTLSGKLFATSKAVATADTYGLIKVGYTASGQNIPVKLDNGNAFVTIPTIPTVNNATVTIKQRGAVVKSFTLNQSTNTTIELTDYNNVPNNPTITFQRNGATFDTITLDQSSPKTINFIDNDTKYTSSLSDNVNLNNVTNAGFYRYNNGVTNGPNGAGSHGQMLVVRGDADTIAQLVFPYGNSIMYFRTGNWVNNGNGTAHGWEQVVTKSMLNISDSAITNSDSVRCYIKMDDNGKPYVDVPVSISGTAASVNITIGSKKINISQSSESASLNVITSL